MEALSLSMYSRSSTHEAFADIGPARHRTRGICTMRVAGTFVYTQERGAIKPNIRQNTGRYTLQD